MKRMWRIAAIVAMAAAPVAMARARAADCKDSELCAGKTISAENIDRLKDVPFEGVRLGELLAERVAWQVREKGLKIVLRNSQPYPTEPHFAAASAKNVGKVTLDPTTKLVKGWEAGTPFPNIDTNDPLAGYKVVYNMVYGLQKGDAVTFPKIAFLLVGEKEGLERTQVWSFRRIYMKGRVMGGPATLGDGETLYKSALYAVLPQDIKGLGSFNIRYDGGKLDDSWAYIHEVRRIRRLSGGAWMDPIGSTDELNDDFNIINAFPTWYKDFKLVGKKKVLVVGHAQKANWVETAPTPAEQFPYLDLGHAPHWNMTDQWEPREVYIVEGTPPDQHPYGKKIMYFDVQASLPYLCDIYDKSNNFQKWGIRGSTVWPMTGEADGAGMWSAWGMTVDFVRGHATVFQGAGDWALNVPMGPDDVSLAVLEAQGR